MEPCRLAESLFHFQLLIHSLKFCGQSFLLFLFVLCANQAFGQKGSVIVIQTKGLVEAISPNGAKLTEPVVRGSVLPEGYSIKTNLFSESVLLLSNGTTATIQENSVFKLIEFNQKPFDTQNQSFGQLENEPSTSQVSIEMEIGSLVVQTKKLNKSSSFSIRTPTGTAGILGTQFQLASSPNTGMQLDVAESQVAFTPVGKNQPVVVGPGRGLDASPNGTVKERPINPIVSQNITVKNSAASNSCAVVPLATAKQANSQSESTPISNAVETDKIKDESTNDEDSEKDAAESFLKTSSSSGQRIVSGQESAQLIFLEKAKQLSKNEGIYVSTILQKISSNPTAKDKISNPDLGDDDSENNPSPPSLTPPPPISGFNLQFNDLDELELISLDLLDQRLGAPHELVGLNRSELETLLDPHFKADEIQGASIALEAFLKHSNLTNYDNDNVNDSFRMAFFISSLFFEDLTGDEKISGVSFSLVHANWTDIMQGNITPGAVLNAADLIQYYQASPYLYDLGITLIDEGVLGSGVTTNNVAKELLDYFGGSSGIAIPNSFTLGSMSENGNDYLFNSALLGANHNDLIKAENSKEKQAELDRLFKVYSHNINAVLGSEIHIGSPDHDTVINIGEWLKKAEAKNGFGVEDDNKIFAFAAGKDLHLAGNVKFENSFEGIVNKSEDHALVLGSSQNTVIGAFEDIGEPAQGSSLYFEGSNLGIGSYDDLTVVNVDIDVGGNLAMGTLGNLDISRSTIKVGRNSDRDNVYMYAEDLLKAEDLVFSGRTREIYMEANTIDLRSVHFPANSEVMLRSREGAPFFYGPGTKNPEYKPLYVNFYSDTNRYGNSAITEGEFSPNGTNGFNSTSLKTNNGDSAIKIRAIPN